MNNKIIYKNGIISEIKVYNKSNLGYSETTYFKKGNYFYIKSDNLNNTIKARLIQLPSMIQRIFLAKTKKGVRKLKAECTNNLIKKTSAFNRNQITDFVEVKVI